MQVYGGGAGAGIGARGPGGFPGGAGAEYGVHNPGGAYFRNMDTSGACGGVPGAGTAAAGMAAGTGAGFSATGFGNSAAFGGGYIDMDLDLGMSADGGLPTNSAPFGGAAGGGFCPGTAGFGGGFPGGPGGVGQSNFSDGGASGGSLSHLGAGMPGSRGAAAGATGPSSMAQYGGASGQLLAGVAAQAGGLASHPGGASAQQLQQQQQQHRQQQFPQSYEQQLPGGAASGGGSALGGGGLGGRVGLPTYSGRPELDLFGSSGGFGGGYCGGSAGAAGGFGCGAPNPQLDSEDRFGGGGGGGGGGGAGGGGGGRGCNDGGGKGGGKNCGKNSSSRGGSTQPYLDEQLMMEFTRQNQSEQGGGRGEFGGCGGGCGGCGGGCGGCGGGCGAGCGGGCGGCCGAGCGGGGCGGCYGGCGTGCGGGCCGGGCGGGGGGCGGGCVGGCGGGGCGGGCGGCGVGGGGGGGNFGGGGRSGGGGGGFFGSDSRGGPQNEKGQQPFGGCGGGGGRGGGQRGGKGCGNLSAKGANQQTPTHSNLFVGNLPDGASKELLGNVFGSYGVVVSCRIFTGNDRTCALVKMGTVEEAETACREVQRSGWTVKFADSDADGSAGGKGRGGPGGGKGGPFFADGGNCLGGVGGGSDSGLWDGGGGGGPGGGCGGFGPFNKGGCGGKGRKGNRCQGGKGEPSSNLYVRGLPTSVTEAQLHRTFSKAGKIIESKILRYSDSQDCSALVRMDSVEAASKAIVMLSSTPLEGCVPPLVVSYQGKASTVPSDNLYVKGLPPDFTQEHLQALFSQVGTVRRCRILPPSSSAPAATDVVALVQMSCADEATRAMDFLNGKMPPGARPQMFIRFAEQNGDADRAPSTNLYVKGLPSGAPNYLLRSVFRQYGNVTWLKVMEPKDQTATDCVALVEMATVEEAAAAVEGLHGRVLAPPMPPMRVRFAGKEQKLGTNLYVAGLPVGIQEDQLRATFEKCGAVSRLRLLVQPGSLETHALVQMSTPQEAARAIECLNGHAPESTGPSLIVRFAKERSIRAPNGGDDQDDSQDGGMSGVAAPPPPPPPATELYS